MGGVRLGPEARVDEKVEATFEVTKMTMFTEISDSQNQDPAERLLPKCRSRPEVSFGSPKLKILLPGPDGLFHKINRIF